MKKVISLAVAFTFMVTMAFAQQGPTPAKPVAKEGAKKECAGGKKDCCAKKTTASASASKAECKDAKKACCAKKGEAAGKAKQSGEDVK